MMSVQENALDRISYFYFCNKICLFKDEDICTNIAHLFRKQGWTNSLNMSLCLE
jgi:hypothetical protein